MSIAESLTAQTPLGSALRAGLETLSLGQTITFTKYVRLVLPLDGFVFWVKADLLSTSALLNASRLNSFGANQRPRVITPAPTVVAQGSLHYATDARQEEVANYAANHVVFTSEIEVDDFNQVGSEVLLLGEFNGIKFAFNKRGSFYSQAGLYHYTGDAVYSFMESQFVDKLDGFDVQNVVVSNSLPLWLALPTPTGIPMLGGVPCPLFPSYLVPDNQLPPYGVIHVQPESTTALQAVPRVDRNSNHYQLVNERVKITFYGVRNFGALDFQDYVVDYTLNTENFGLSNMPVTRDERQPQSEINAIAMKKTIEFQINYYQTRARNVARQLIESCIVDYEPDGFINTRGGFYSDGGVLCVTAAANYPTSSAGLPTGALWSNSGTVAVVGPVSGGSLKLLYRWARPDYLLQIGGGEFPSSPPIPPDGSIWNNGGELAIANMGGFYINGGVLCLLPVQEWQQSPIGLLSGSVWSNGGDGGTISIVPGEPLGLKSPEILDFAFVASGNLLIFRLEYLAFDPWFVGQLWNNGWEVAVASQADIGIATGLYSDGGVLCVTDDQGWPTSALDVGPGDVWSNGGTVCIAAGRVYQPLDYLPPFGQLTARTLKTIGGAWFPTSAGPAGSGVIWNNGGELAVS